MTITTEMLTRNIAKSGEVLNWNGFSPFQLHLLNIAEIEINFIQFVPAAAASGSI